MGIPESTHSNAQGFQRYGHSWKEFNGLFFGFKLHLICNEKGELLSFVFTPDDVDDRVPLYDKNFIDQIIGEFVGDRGDIIFTICFPVSNDLVFLLQAV